MITKDSKNILVADDSLFFRTKLSDILVAAGHKVKLAKDGNEAINKIKLCCNEIDLLSLDLQMPDVDGFGVLEWIQQNGYTGKFIILVVTGIYVPSHVLDRLYSLGATGFMPKTFKPEETIFKVNQLLFPEKCKTGKSSKRAPVSIPADYTVDGVTRTSYILNLSETGVFIFSNAELSVGTKVNLQFALPRLHLNLNIDGIVKWHAEENIGKNFFCGYGIYFTSISEEDQEILRNFINEETERLGLEAQKPSSKL